MLDSAYQKAREINDELEELLKDTLTNLLSKEFRYKNGEFSLPKKFFKLTQKTWQTHGIRYVEQEESYTFLNQDKMPVYGDSEYELLGN